MFWESWKKKTQNPKPFSRRICLRKIFTEQCTQWAKRFDFLSLCEKWQIQSDFFSDLRFGTVLEFKLHEFDVSHMASRGIWKWIDANLHGNGLQMLHWWIHLWTWVRAMLIGIKLINNWFYSCSRSSAQIIDKTFQTYLNFNQFPRRVWIYD